ncbi:MAG: hypothetical protein DHS20C21_15320 [Gemmatimonadota bacterium]|nr:MAG: hypothetical protein DHS20C21_15320 [Gemmatimonadota bacterium]
MAKRAIPSLRVLPESTNRGFAAGINRGLAEATGDVVILLNPDAVPEGDALHALATATRTHPELGLLGGVVTDPSGRIDVCCARPLPVLNDILWEGVFLPKRRTDAYRRLVRGADPEPIPVAAVSGAAIAVLRRNLDRIGFMNEQYFLYNEDIEWCECSSRAGLPVAVVPAARFTHRQGSTTRRNEAIPFAARMLADFQFFVEFRGTAAGAVRWRWHIRQRVRQWLYGIDALIGAPSRRSRSRARTRIYGDLAARVASLRWAPANEAQSAHPDRLDALSKAGGV